MKSTEVLIIGGGLAGLTAALDLSGKGHQVLVVEKKEYPQHKVCGEYVSNEVKPYLEKLGVDFGKFQLPNIDTLQLSTQKGRSVTVKLPLGGFGISRFSFDKMLYELALEKGVGFLFTAASQIDFQEEDFLVQLKTGESVKAKVVLGAFGKRSGLDIQLNLRDSEQKSPWLGVKCHYAFDDHPENMVSLHNFPGGYAGMSQVENGIVNLCYLVGYQNFQKIGDVGRFNQQVLAKNPFLHRFFQNAVPQFERPMSIAQISFGRKSAVQNHVLMCGDTAGMIHPLCGNGMAMAIHSAKLASREVNRFLRNSHVDRKTMEIDYARAWSSHFKNRIWLGGQLQKLMLHTKWFDLGMRTVANSKIGLEMLIRKTHGTPILN